MAPGHHPSKSQRNRVLLFRLQQFFEAGQFNVKTIATATGANKQTVWRRRREWKRTGRLLVRHSPGRPRKLDGDQRRRLHQIAVRNPSYSNTLLASRLKECGNVTVSRWTVARALVEMKIDRKRPSRKPLLTDEHKRRRLAWCMSNLDRDWSRVVFTDESRMQFYSNVRKMLVKSHKKPVVETKKFGPALMLWGGISMRGQTPLAICRGTIGSDEYIQTLDSYLIPTMQTLYPDGYCLQQDNASCHVSRKTKEYLANQGIAVLSWPAQSPDLNVIENVWGLIKTKLASVMRTTVEDWEQRIMAIWDEFSHDYMKSLVESMPRRLQQCIERNGGHTDY